jgi:hypothetical protein
METYLKEAEENEDEPKDMLATFEEIEWAWQGADSECVAARGAYRRILGRIGHGRSDMAALALQGRSRLSLGWRASLAGYAARRSGRTPSSKTTRAKCKGGTDCMSKALHWSTS